MTDKPIDWIGTSKEDISNFPEAAAFFKETQPRISNLINGEISRFSVDKLVNMLAQAGMDVKVEVVSLSS